MSRWPNAIEPQMYDFEDWLIKKKLSEGIKGIDFLVSMMVGEKEYDLKHFLLTLEMMEEDHPDSDIEDLLFNSLDPKQTYETFHDKWGYNLGIVQVHAFNYLNRAKRRDMDQYLDILFDIQTLHQQ